MSGWEGDVGGESPRLKAGQLVLASSARDGGATPYFAGWQRAELDAIFGSPVQRGSPRWSSAPMPSASTRATSSLPWRHVISFRRSTQ